MGDDDQRSTGDLTKLDYASPAPGRSSWKPLTFWTIIFGVMHFVAMSVALVGVLQSDGQDIVAARACRVLAEPVYSLIPLVTRAVGRAAHRHADSLLILGVVCNSLLWGLVPASIMHVLRRR